MASGICACGFNFDNLGDDEWHICRHTLGDGLTKHVDIHFHPVEMAIDDKWIVVEAGDPSHGISQIGPSLDLNVTPPTAHAEWKPTLIEGQPWAEQQPIRWWPLPLKWTTERPTKAGFYWHRSSAGQEEVVEVDSHWMSFFGDSRQFRVRDVDGEWSDSPIARPEGT